MRPRAGKKAIMDRLDQAAHAMAASSLNPRQQRAQTSYRLGLVDGWGIRPGESVLEIGCGQGDTTAALAAAVGSTGNVLAVDQAGADYGAPVTLGASAAMLARSPLGRQITFQFGFDVLGSSLPADSFDHVVLSHCSWYFSPAGQLRQVLRRARALALHLCFAEWDLEPATPEQLPHLLAVLAQGHLEAAGSRGSGNVRTPHSREAAVRAITEAGWEPAAPRTADTAELADADWEIAECLRIVSTPSRMAGVPEATAELIKAQVRALGLIAAEHGNMSLPSYSLTARRAPGG
jgi:SAM-dependent methyltransferase